MVLMECDGKPLVKTWWVRIQAKAVRMEMRLRLGWKGLDKMIEVLLLMSKAICCDVVSNDCVRS
jgi:hypothetical protein